MIEQTRAINMKVYAEIAPMANTRAVAGMSALGALPKAAIPGDAVEGGSKEEFGVN